MDIRFKAIDLTHTLHENPPSWDGSCGFQKTITFDYSDNPGPVSFRVQQFHMHAGIGTHMDAPAHCIPGGKTIDQLPLTDLISPCVVIDVSSQAHERYSVTVEDILQFEATYGKINPNTFVMIKTGWEKFWNEPEKYRNNHVFPSVSSHASNLFVERQIIGLGIDTFSPDRPEDGYLVHAILLGAGKYIIENAANLSTLPHTGSFIMALPMKVRDGTEAPVRLVGLIYK